MQYKKDVMWFENSTMLCVRHM